MVSILKWQRRGFAPKTAGDAIAMTFLIIMTFVTYVFELSIVLHFLHSPLPFLGYYFHCFLGTYLLLEIFTNFYMIVSVDTSITTVSVATSDKFSWHGCASCEAVVPPRSRHCHICKTCVLKREHHCTFTGCCIGHYNHRYFLWLLFFLWFGASYCVVINLLYLKCSISLLTLDFLLRIIFPLLSLFFKSLPLVHLLCCLLTSLCLASALFTGILFYYQFRLVVLGVVSHEVPNKITKYDVGWKKNLLLVFGEKWYLTWLFGTIKSALPTDGSEFPTNRK